MNMERKEIYFFAGMNWKFDAFLQDKKVIISCDLKYGTVSVNWKNYCNLKTWFSDRFPFIVTNAYSVMKNSLILVILYID